MSKVIFTADIHFGVSGRLNDIVFACRVIREYAKRANIDTVVVLGDLFHDRQALGIDVLNAACEFFEDAKNEYNQQWIAFPGNHDLFLKHSWNINSLIPLKNHLTIINDVKLLILDDQRFIVLPFITYEKYYMKVLRRIAKRCEKGDKLLTHIGVCGSILNTCFLLKDWSIVTFENMPFEKIYTGHFHSRQKVGDNVYYPGSPIPFKFDEGNIAHGFYVYDTETNDHKFINIWKAAKKLIPNETPPPQFCTILDEQVKDLQESDIKNNFVRIVLQEDHTEKEKNDIKDFLHKLGARRVRWMNVNKQEEEKFQEIKRQFETKNLFRAWIQQDVKGTKNLDNILLNKLHDEIVCESDEIYVAEEIESA
jgi:DNA repair exonuclease SbcCD nuclease subunit